MVGCADLGGVAAGGDGMSEEDVRGIAFSCSHGQNRAALGLTLITVGFGWTVGGCNCYVDGESRDFADYCVCYILLATEIPPVLCSLVC